MAGSSPDAPLLKGIDINPSPGGGVISKANRPEVKIKLSTSSEKPQYTPLEQTRAYQRANTEQYGRERLNKVPEVEDSTKQTCARAFVREFNILKSFFDDNGAISDAVLPRDNFHRRFLQLFESQYELQNPGKSLRTATEQELEGFSRKLMDDDKYQLWAIKLAEVQQVALELSTEAKIKAVIEGEELKDVSPMVTVGDAGSQESTRMLVKTGNAVSRFFSIRGRDARSRSALVDLTNESYDMKQEGKKMTNVQYKVDFADAANLITHDTIRGPGGGPLDAVQRAYIRQLHLISNLKEGETLRQPDRQAVRTDLEAIIAARRNFYAHHGSPLIKENDIKMLRQRAGGGYEYNTPSNRPAMALEGFGFNMPGRTVEVGHGGGTLETQLNTVMDGLQNEMELELDKGRISAMHKKMSERIEKLKAEVDAEKAKTELSPDDKKKVAPIEDEIKKLTQEEKDIEAYTPLEEEIKALNEQISELDAQLGAEVVSYNTDSDPNSIKNDEIELENLNKDKADLASSIGPLFQELNALEDYLEQIEVPKTPLQNNINILQLQIKGLEDSRTVEQDQLNKLHAALSGANQRFNKAKAGSPEQTAAQNDIDTYNRELPILSNRIKTEYSDKINIYRDQIVSLSEAIGNIDAAANLQRTSINSKKKEITQAKAENQALIDLKTDVIKKKKEKSEEKAEKIKERQQWIDKREQKRRLKVNLEAKYPKMRDVNTVAAEIQAKKDEKEKVGKKTNILRQREIDAYTVLQDVMSPEQHLAIYERASKSTDYPIVNQQLARAEVMYPRLPPAYLRTLQVLFGYQIVDDKKQFDNATRVLPPNRFLELIQREPRGAASPLISGVTNIYDRTRLEAARNEMLHIVDGVFIADVLEGLEHDVYHDRIGKLPGIDEARVRKMERTVPEDSKKLRKQHTDQIEGNKKAMSVATLQRRFPTVITSQAEGDAVVNRITELRTQNKTDAEIITDLQTNALTLPGGLAMTLSPPNVANIVNAVSERTRFATTVQEIMSNAFSHELGIDRAIILAGIAEVAGPTVAMDIAKGIYQGELLPTIIGSLTVADQAAANRIIVDVSPFLTPPFDITRVQNTVRNSVIALRYPGGASTAEQNEIVQTFQFVDAIDKKQIFEEDIEQLERDIPHYETVEELALQIVNLRGQSESYYPQAKMLALEVDKRRTSR